MSDHQPFYALTYVRCSCGEVFMDPAATEQFNAHQSGADAPMLPGGVSRKAGPESTHKRAIRIPEPTPLHRMGR